MITKKSRSSIFFLAIAFGSAPWAIAGGRPEVYRLQRNSRMRSRSVDDRIRNCPGVILVQAYYKNSTQVLGGCAYI
ncbi:hypothetical protein [Scytonema sp. PRP1]|uniref:hypothetical protein n=1 Tax=Scytonema sp. PRP1 TaxID=3120513 RepID=UPI00300D24E1